MPTFSRFSSPPLRRTLWLLTLTILTPLHAADFPLHLGSYLDSDPATPLGLAIADAGEIIIALERPGGDQIQVRRPDTGALLDTLTPGAGLNFLRGAPSSGAWAASGDFGVVISDASGVAIETTVPLGSFATTPTRVALCGQRVVVLAGSQVTLLSGTGGVLNQFSVSATQLADVACSESDALSYVTGYRQVSANLQMAFIEAHDNNGLVWEAWNHSASEASNANLGSDTRGRVLAMGADGWLYFAGSSAGGVPVYKRDPQDISQNANNIGFDSYNQTFNMGGQNIVYYARLDPANGALQAGQFLLTRLNSGSGNTAIADSLSVDASGTLQLGGRANASLADRNNLSLSGQAVAGYAGRDPHLLVVPSDFQSRSHWTTFIGPEGRGDVVAVASRDGRQAFLIRVIRAEMLTRGAFIDGNALSTAPTDTAPFAYLGTWGNTQYTGPGEIHLDGFEGL